MADLWDEVPFRARSLYRTSLKNAAVRSIPFELTKEMFAAIWVRSEGRCMLTNLPFDLATTSGEYRQWRRNPWAPSLDRIDNSEGYVPKNCRMVCACVNIALNEWGETVLYKMALGLLGHEPSDHGLSRSGSGLPQGVSPIRRDGKTRFRVRFYVAGALTDFGCFDTLDEAVAVLDREKTTRSTAKQLSTMVDLFADG